MAEKNLEGRLFEIVTSMYTACPVVLEEPSIMAAARIVKWAEQLIELLESRGLSDEFLSTWRQETLANITAMMSDPDRFMAWVDEATSAFVLEARRRNIEATRPHENS